MISSTTNPMFSCAETWRARITSTTLIAPLNIPTFFILSNNLKFILIHSRVKNFIFQLLGQFHFPLVENDIPDIVLHKLQWRNVVRDPVLINLQKVKIGVIRSLIVG